MRNYRNIRAFQEAHALAVRVYGVCGRVGYRHPRLAAQLRGAAESVSANIVEGCGHSSRREFARFLQLALASSGEVDYHLQFAVDVKAITAELHDELAATNREVNRKLSTLLRVVRDELSEAERAGDGAKRVEPVVSGRKPRSRMSRHTGQVTSAEQATKLQHHEPPTG